VCVGGAKVNKAQLTDALAERLGDRKIAAAAVTALVDVVVRAVTGGDRVTITGFGVFEKRARAARIARNPRTGEAVTVEQTDVPVFRPGTLFREVVSGTRVLPRAEASTDAVVGRATRVTGAVPLTSVGVAAASAATKETKTATKATKATKIGKTRKEGKATKAELKATAKAPVKGATKAPVKSTAKKAGKKSATKK
jgi:DNA-binding protein HU-beta